MNILNRKNLILTLGVVAGVLLAMWPAAAQTGGEEWQWQNPLPQGNPLGDVWGSGPSDVFAVGDVGTIVHYDGTGWSVMSSGTHRCLAGVWGSSASDVFVVGSYGTILHHGGAPHLVFLPLALRNYAP